MEHIGIDLGGRESQICIRDADGKIIHEHRVLTRLVGETLSRRPKSRVVLETCAESFAIADTLKDAGHTVNIVPATLVRSLGVGARGIKTDVRDARLQSELSCRMKELPQVHIPSHSARQLKTALNMRDVLIRSRTMHVNAVRGEFRKTIARVRCTPETMPERVREALGDAIAPCLERILVAITTLNAQIDAADKDLAAYVKDDPICRLLMTAPAVGPVTAARFVSSIDDITRFPSAHALESYLGLTPGENSSSDRVRRTGITKAGASPLRGCLVQASWTIFRTRPSDPLAQWGQSVMARRGKQIAVCAIARKLAGILYAMWRDKRTYDSNHMPTNRQKATM